MACTPSHDTVTLTLDPGPCTTKCEGCTFTEDITSKFDEQQNACIFSGKVYRKNCLNSSDAEWTVNETVSCPGSVVRKYACDDEGDCERFQVTFRCMSPGGPGGS